MPLRPLTLAAVALLLALLVVAGIKTWHDLAGIERHEAELRREITARELRIAELQDRIERLRHDPATLERVARSELHMVYPGEVEVVLPAQPPAPPAHEPSLRTDTPAEAATQALE